MTTAPTLLRPRAALSCVFLANGSGLGAWAASVPWVQRRFELAPPELGLLLLELAIGSIAAMMLTGRLVDRFGSVPVMRAGCGAFALVLALPALASTVPALGLSIALIGATAGASDVAVNAQASEVERQGGRPMMSGFHAAFSLGGIAGAVCASLFGLAWSAVPVAALALIACRLPGLPDPPRPARRAGIGFLGWPMLGLCAMAAACMMAEGAMADWSGLFLRDVSGVPADLAGFGFAVYSLAMTAARLGGDATLRWLGRVRAVRLGALLAGAALALALAWPRGWGGGQAAAFAALFLVGIGLANVVPSAFSAGGNSSLLSPAAGIALIATIGYGGFLLGPPAIGFAAGALGLRAALLLVVAACLAVAASARLLAPRLDRPVR